MDRLLLSLVVVGALILVLSEIWSAIQPLVQVITGILDSL